MCKCKAGVEVINDGTMVWCLECGAVATLVWEKKTPTACPFCGNSRDVKALTNYDLGQHEDDCEMYTVVCCVSQHPGDDSEGCGASSGYYYAAKEAIDAWNTREEEE